MSVMFVLLKICRLLISPNLVLFLSAAASILLVSLQRRLRGILAWFLDNILVWCVCVHVFTCYSPHSPHSQSNIWRDILKVLPNFEVHQAMILCTMISMVASCIFLYTLDCQLNFLLFGLINELGFFLCYSLSVPINTPFFCIPSYEEVSIETLLLNTKAAGIFSSKYNESNGSFCFYSKVANVAFWLDLVWQSLWCFIES